MATPFREGKVWSFRLRIKSEDIFQTGFPTQAAARKAMEDQRQALKSEGKPAHRGPWRTNLAEALAQYARERLGSLLKAEQAVGEWSLGRLHRAVMTRIASKAEKSMFFHARLRWCSSSDIIFISAKLLSLFWQWLQLLIAFGCAHVRLSA